MPSEVMAGDAPNVVLICVDQWRGDCLSYLGHPVLRTPYLDQFAAEGACFERAYTATPSCIPARAALLTGLAPERNGRVGYQDGVPWDYPVTLGGEFTRHGYQTEAVGKLHVYPERSQVGFQHVVLHDGYLHFARRRDRRSDPAAADDYLAWLRQQSGDPSADYFDTGLNCNAQTARPWDKEERLHPTNFVVTQAVDFLRRRDPRKPFFLYLGFHRPHPPYDPPAWAFEEYLAAPRVAPPVGDWEDDVFGPDRGSFRADPQVGRLSPDALHRARAGYYGLMTQIDHQINRLVETLQEYGHTSKNTYFCFVSDHGELLGDHDCFRKSLPYEGSARVPLLLWGPGIPRGTRVGAEAVVELRDILPTLLDCAGLPAPPDLDGRSFLPWARGEAPSGWRPYLHGEHPVLGQSCHYLTDGREKYVWWGGTGQEQLFDLENDPEERHDLARAGGAGAGRVAPWRERLVRELTGREEGFVQNGGLVTGRPPRAVLSQPLPPRP